MKKSVTLAAAAMLAVLALGLGGGDAFAYQTRSDALRSTLGDYQRQGVPSQLLDPIRSELDARRLPVSALLRDPLADPLADLEAQARSAFALAMESSRTGAELALSAWQSAAGGDGSLYAGPRQQMLDATTPVQLDQLADRWRLWAETAQLERDTLAAAAGGYAAGRPEDIAELAAGLDAAVEAAAAVHVVDDPAPALRMDLAGYLALDAGGQLAQHDDLRSELEAGIDRINNRVAEKNQANQLVAGLDDLFAAASTVAVPAGMADQIARARSDATIAAGDEQLAAALSELQAITNTLRDIAFPHPGGRLPPCIAGSSGQLIAIHLVTQQLIAYQDGCPWLAAPVTSGRPQLPTGRGTFRIFYKAPAYKMVSPWPPGSQFWYPTTWVYDAMEFIGDGTFIHSADWQPDDSYGQGSEFGPYASHGCVHVPAGPLAELYAWAELGATVVVGD